MAGHVAIIGGGVIGGGWAARFALMGWEVRVFDPAPEAARRVQEVLAGAREALPRVLDAPLPPEGEVVFTTTMSEAVTGARWIQESVPERLELKQTIYQTLQSHVDPAAVIASSTSGFKPSDLQAMSRRPEQIIVAHPFVPVYLLPAVEIAGSDITPPEVLDTAEEFLTGIGMYPLRLAQEIDAHIADRLLEAVWREALWLVKDGIATTEQVDDAIRMGFGLRWAQMGLFETYRLGGGEGGMRQFLHQFGPALQWPWTKLTDVPEMDDELVETIATQSDAQSGAYEIPELEKIRDGNLVALLNALKQQDWGAGAVLKGVEARLKSGG